jgi:hypothetical protein
MAWDSKGRIILLPMKRRIMSLTIKRKAVDNMGMNILVMA